MMIKHDHVAINLLVPPDIADQAPHRQKLRPEASKGRGSSGWYRDSVQLGQRLQVQLTKERGSLPVAAQLQVIKEQL